MREKILVVEDDCQNMRLLEMTLKSRNYTVLKATDGEEALNMTVSERPDLIIMDIRLPVMSGVEVTKKLKEDSALSHIPIIALTAYAMKGDRERIIKTGCDAYLSKPVSPRALSGAVAEMLPLGGRITSSIG